MKRTTAKVHLDATTTQYRVRLESEDCELGTLVARFIQTRMLQSMVDSLDLVVCGPVPFHKLLMQHNGDRWVIEAEATVEVSDVKTAG